MENQQFYKNVVKTIEGVHFRFTCTNFNKFRASIKFSGQKRIKTV